jgi:hypothetical protein
MEVEIAKTAHDSASNVGTYLEFTGREVYDFSSSEKKKDVTTIAKMTVTIELKYNTGRERKKIETGPCDG